MQTRDFGERFSTKNNKKLEQRQVELVIKNLIQL